MRYNLRTLLILAATTGWLSLAPATAEQPTSAPATTSQARYVSPTDRQGFNPQPDPPAKQGLTAPGSTRSFNPQPEPPARSLQNSGYPTTAGQRGFNPQPEPPATPSTTIRR